jgi:Cft2 family RNA processing exonuclease
MSWEIEYNNGLRLPQLGWTLDPRRPVGRAIVSHAHSDHIASCAEVVCTRATARLMRERLRGRRVEHCLPFGHPEHLTDDCAVTLLPAGHIYGSAMVLLEHEEHGSLLYTGDFKLRAGLTAEPCLPCHAELLIMETTFGRPSYRFPPAEETLDRIALFCREALAAGATPVLMAYSLGKTQELLAGIGARGFLVMMHPQCLAMTRLHAELGLMLPPCLDFDPLGLPGHVVIAPPSPPNSAFLRQIPVCRTAFISGWAIDRSTVYRQKCDAAFPLSDHADYQELLDLVEQVRPQRVLTLHGFAVEFAAVLRARGVDALALGEVNQLEMPL